MRKIETLAEVAGAGARTIRLEADATLAQVADAARSYGLKWSSGKVAAFEAGQIKNISLPTLLAVTAALTEVTGRPVGLADLFPDDDRPVAVNDELRFDAATVRGHLHGKPVVPTVANVTGARDRLAAAMTKAASTQGWPKHLAAVSVGRRRAVLAGFSEADERVARSLGVDRALAAAAMASTWGRPFSTERDRLAEGLDANAQKLGRISRELKAQLQEVLRGND